MQWNVENDEMKIKDLANAFHLLKELYALLSTGWVSDENIDHKQFYELPLKFRDYHGTLHNIQSSTVSEDENGEYCVILDEPNPSGYQHSKEYEWMHDHIDLSPFRWQPNDDRWWLHQVTSHTPNREERRKLTSNIRLM